MAERHSKKGKPVGKVSATLTMALSLTSGISEAPAGKGVTGNGAYSGCMEVGKKSPSSSFPSSPPQSSQAREMKRERERESPE